MTHIRTRIIGCGHYLPKNILTNEDLSKIVDTNDEWITERTGIKSRHIVADGEMTSDMAVYASQMALKNAKLEGKDIDLVIVATITPDNLTPATAVKVAGKLGLEIGKIAFDISAACSGFVYALTLADNMIRLGQVKNAIVIGAESLSRITDWSDRNTCILFGDGAGAVVLQASKGDGSVNDRGILSTKLRADGNEYDNLKTLGSLSEKDVPNFLFMNGKEVFKYAVPSLANVAVEVLEELGLAVSDVDWLIPHQANIRIIDAVAKRLEIVEEKVVKTVDHCGNTSAASIPIALSESVNSGKVKDGDLVVFSAMGAGFTWGGAVVRM